MERQTSVAWVEEMIWMTGILIQNDRMFRMDDNIGKLRCLGTCCRDNRKLTKPISGICLVTLTLLLLLTVQVNIC